MTTIRIQLTIPRSSTREQLGLEAEAVRRRMNVPQLEHDLVLGDPLIRAALADLRDLAAAVIARAGDSYDISAALPKRGASRADLMRQRALQSFGHTEAIATQTGIPADRLRELRGDTTTKENTP